MEQHSFVVNPVVQIFNGESHPQKLLFFCGCCVRNVLFSQILDEDRWQSHPTAVHGGGGRERGGLLLQGGGVERSKIWVYGYRSTSW